MFVRVYVNEFEFVGTPGHYNKNQDHVHMSEFWHVKHVVPVHWLLLDHV